MTVTIEELHDLLERLDRLDLVRCGDLILLPRGHLQPQSPLSWFTNRSHQLSRSYRVERPAPAGLSGGAPAGAQKRSR